VVELAELIGRDYTTASRQVTKLDGLGLIKRRPSKTDKRVREAVITAKGKEMTSAIDAAREPMATALLAKWGKGDLRDLPRLMRRLQMIFSPCRSRNCRNSFGACFIR
jgi:DNA-binding MarR family transcriptional regulator